MPLTDVIVKDDNGTPDNIADDFTVGPIASLAAGASQTLTKTLHISSDRTNFATATGTAPDGSRVVSKSDDAVVDIICRPFRSRSRSRSHASGEVPTPPLHLVPTDNGKAVTVKDPVGQGLLKEYTLVGSQAYPQNSLNLQPLSGGGSAEAVGALGSAPIVPDSGMLGGGGHHAPSQLHGRSSQGGGHRRSAQPSQETDLELNSQTQSELFNTLSFVKGDVDPLSGLSVGGVSASAGAAFLEEVRDNLTNFSYTLGGEGASGSVFSDPAEAGFYAPVLISGNGDLFTFGTSGGSDGNTHLKELGQNSFGFEDVLASQGSAWDFNDFLFTAKVA